MFSMLATAAAVNLLAAADHPALLAFIVRHERDLVRTGHAIVQQESGGDPNAYRACEDAVGIFQIRPGYVADINAALGESHYRLEDCRDPVKSWEMYLLYMAIYASRYSRPGPEQFARIHNGGPEGPRRRSTVGYWRDVRRRLSSSVAR
jgi:soluble lytic murein transglycosylase-like protein